MDSGWAIMAMPLPGYCNTVTIIMFICITHELNFDCKYKYMYTREVLCLTMIVLECNLPWSL